MKYFTSIYSYKQISVLLVLYSLYLAIGEVSKRLRYAVAEILVFWNLYYCNRKSLILRQF